MSTVLVTKFSEDGTKIDWVHDCGPTAHAENVDVDTLLYGKLMGGGDDKTVVSVPCSVCSAMSWYPMSGGIVSQTLHKHYLEQKNLPTVQADATARSISTSGKTKAQLILLIIQDECIKKGVSYLLG